MPLLYKYRPLRVPSPALTLGGRLTRPKPLIDVAVLGPTGTRPTQAVLDTGADDTVFPDWLAARIGVDLTNADEVEASGVGTAPVARLRIARVTLRLATNTASAEWTALVCFIGNLFAAGRSARRRRSAESWRVSGRICPVQRVTT